MLFGFIKQVYYSEGERLTSRGFERSRKIFWTREVISTIEITSIELKTPFKIK